MSEPLRIDQDDLFSPKVEEYIELHSAARGMAEIPAQPLLIRIIYSNFFYLSIAGLVGALAAWAPLELFINDGQDDHPLIRWLVFPTVAATIGVFVGAAEGIMCRNYGRAFFSAAISLLVGFIGGIVAMVVALFVMSKIEELLFTMFQIDFDKGPFTPMVVLIHMFWRSTAWALVVIPAGLGQGLAIQERKVLINGLVGAILGGLLGGLVFDPISMVLLTADGQAVYSRAAGFGTIGLMVGFFIGLVEQFSKSAWLLMRAGPLAGKQFVLYKQPTVLGSSPKADVYLFKDDAIEPQHAFIHNRGGRFEIEDRSTPAGTFVNEQPVTTRILKSGDQIRLGKTILEFAVKQTE